jgi:hypothetical protein
MDQRLDIRHSPCLERDRFHRVHRLQPEFTVYTELAMTASDRLIIPFSADGSSKRAVRAVLALLYGITRVSGDERSEFFLNTERFRMSSPRIYRYVGNRLTQANLAAAAAFKTVVNEIGVEIWNVWRGNPNLFAVRPSGQLTPGLSVGDRLRAPLTPSAVIFAAKSRNVFLAAWSGCHRHAPASCR